MKTRVLLASIALSVVFTVLAVVGIQRQIVYAQIVTYAFNTTSIDDYLGYEVSLPEDFCTQAAKEITTTLTSSEAPAKLATMKESLISTFENGEITEKTFAKYRANAFLKDLKLDYQMGVGAIENNIKRGLKLDATLVRNEVVTKVASNQLAKEIRTLADSGRAAGASAARWQASFEDKVATVCSSEISQAVSAGAKTYERDVKEFAGAVHEVFIDSWQGKDYEKLSALVAYKAGGSGNCSGYYSSCATFTIKTATPCTVQVEVDFTSGGGDLVDTVTRSVKVEKGLKGISVSVSTDYSASYYDVKEAKCL